MTPRECQGLYGSMWQSIVRLIDILSRFGGLVVQGHRPDIMSINFPYAPGETRDSLTERVPFEKIRRLITWNYYAIRRLIAWNLINLGVAYS